MKTFVLLIALLAAVSGSFIQQHDYWHTFDKTLMEKGIPFTAYLWNWCGSKCLYLHNYNTTANFAWIEFNQTKSSLLPNFGACFVETNVSGKVSYALWDTAITNNTWYSTNCGSDTTNWWNDTLGTAPKYGIVKVVNPGIDYTKWPIPFGSII